MIDLVTLRRLVRRGFARAGASPLASGSWEALRAIVVVSAWTIGLGLAGMLMNLAFFVGSLPEIVSIAKGGSDAIEGGGIFAILLRLVVLLSFVFTSPLALGISIVYLAGFPLLWLWIGLRQGWAISLRRWEGAVRRHLRELAEHTARSAAPEVLEGLLKSARAMGDVIEKMIHVREHSGRIVKWISRKPAAVMAQLRSLLHELPGYEGVEAAEQTLEEVGRHIRFAMPAAVAWTLLANILWFVVVKLLR